MAEREAVSPDTPFLMYTLLDLAEREAVAPDTPFFIHTLLKDAERLSTFQTNAYAQELNVTHIVNACRCENPFATWISYCSCDLADTATEDLVRACVF